MFKITNFLSFTLAWMSGGRWRDMYLMDINEMIIKKYRITVEIHAVFTEYRNT